jgi:hypothetical protein
MATAAELTTQVARLEERVSNHINFFRVGAVIFLGWLGWMSVQVYQIRSSVNPLVSTHQLTKAAEHPTDPKSQTEVLRVIGKAKESQIPIPTLVLAEAGKSFSEASERDPNAWKTVSVLMEYRTNVNAITFIFPPAKAPPEDTHFFAPKISGKPAPQLSFVESGTPIAVAARLQAIGKPTNTGVNLGPTHLILSGGATSLDNMDIAHTFFVGVEVHYSGADTILDDVLFVNCTFVFDNSARSRMLAENIIASKNVNFPS